MSTNKALQIFQFCHCPSSFRAESQQLAKIYALLNENKDKFGEVSMKDIKSQMSMYKTD